MKHKEDLQRELWRIDGRGYKAYKDIQGQYDYGNYMLSIDYVQGDPFASPSRVRTIVKQEIAKIPACLFDKKHKMTAVCDFFTRLFAKKIHKFYDSVGGSGKSGLLAIDRPGQEILERTSVVINEDRIEARFEVGLPASGRRILGKPADKIFSYYLPQIVNESLLYENIDRLSLDRYVELSEDQYYLRGVLKEKGLVAFTANGSVLPRESGISDRPLPGNAVVFKSPESMEESFHLPFYGEIKGMGIKQGITLITGGGYHGKSTLLNALQLGIYNHIPGDGREYVVVNQDAVKIKAEDGRRVEKVNISPFINNLPGGQDTKRFSTENASGSTSQASNIIEALEAGTSLILVDEDTSATNFMIRDARMQKLVTNNKEPITPYIDKVVPLYEDLKVSTILVAGGSGDYFDVADTVIMMDRYVPEDATGQAKEIAEKYKTQRELSIDKPFGEFTARAILKKSFPEGPKGRKIKAKGIYEVMYNKSSIDLSALEQLKETSQTNCLAVMLKYASEKTMGNEKTINEIIQHIYKQIEDNGLDSLSGRNYPGNLSLPAKYQFAAMLNRYRGLHIR